MTLGDHRKAFYKLLRTINTNIEIFNSGKVLVMERMLFFFFLSEGFVIVTCCKHYRHLWGKPGE